MAQRIRKLEKDDTLGFLGDRNEVTHPDFGTWKTTARAAFVTAKQDVLKRLGNEVPGGFQAQDFFRKDRKNPDGKTVQPDIRPLLHRVKNATEKVPWRRLSDGNFEFEFQTTGFKTMIGTTDQGLVRYMAVMRTA